MATASQGSTNLARKGTPDEIEGLAPPAEAGAGTVILVIEPVEWEKAGLPEGARIVKIPFRALTLPLLAETQPVMVLGTLVSPQLDAMQIAERLGELGYRGTLAVLGPMLPKPSLVAREIRAASGSKDITIDMLVEV
jgi:hypothetical protein